MPPKKNNASNPYKDKPDNFLSHVVQVGEQDIKRYVDGLDAGFEEKVWRGDGFAKHLLDWLPEFALTAKQLKEFKAHNWLPKVQRALSKIYETDKKIEGRGEIGEILLHIAIRQIYNSEPVVCKVYYKTAANDPVKGWDAAHFVKAKNGQYELWLGEAKFYTDPNEAFNKAIKSLKEHMELSFIKKERDIILALSEAGNFSIPKEISQLLHQNTSIDEVKKRLCVPILVTYESDVLKEKYNSEYGTKLNKEIAEHYASFLKKIENEFKAISIRLILVPLQSKKILVQAFDKKIKALQGI